MGWSVTTHNLPGCATFEGAKKIWDSAPSYEAHKAWGEHKRPLENKRMPHKAIVKHSGVNLHAYSLCLHGAPLITYHEDGHIGVVHHESQSSSNFFRRMKPPGVHYWGKSNLIRVNTQRGDEWFQNSRGTFTLEQDGYFDGLQAWKVTSATDQRMRTVTDLKRTAQINKALSEFVMWWKCVEKLTDRRPVTGYPHEPAARVMPHKLPAKFTAEHFPALLDLEGDIQGIKHKLFAFYGAFSREPVDNDVKPIQRPRHWCDT